MAGVEPASERFDPRIYYECSLFIGLTSQRRNKQNRLRRSTQTRKPSFASRRVSAGSTLTLWRPLRDRPAIRCGWTWPEKVNAAQPLRRLGSERHCSVGSAIVGTWFFVLILRGRHLSTRNPGPASPVETGTSPIHNAIIPAFLHFSLRFLLISLFLKTL